MRAAPAAPPSTSRRVGSASTCRWRTECGRRDRAVPAQRRRCGATIGAAVGVIVGLPLAAGRRIGPERLPVTSACQPLLTSDKRSYVTTGTRSDGRRPRSAPSNAPSSVARCACRAAATAAYAAAYTVRLCFAAGVTAFVTSACVNAIRGQRKALPGRPQALPANCGTSADPAIARMPLMQLDIGLWIRTPTRATAGPKDEQRCCHGLSPSSATLARTSEGRGQRQRQACPLPRHSSPWHDPWLLPVRGLGRQHRNHNQRYLTTHPGARRFPPCDAVHCVECVLRSARRRRLRGVGSGRDGRPPEPRVTPRS